MRSALFEPLEPLPPDAVQSSAIYIKNLHLTVDEVYLDHLVASFGDVLSTTLPTDQRTGERK